jgi:hypothetical protein
MLSLPIQMNINGRGVFFWFDQSTFVVFCIVRAFDNFGLAFGFASGSSRASSNAFTLVN